MKRYLVYPLQFDTRARTLDEIPEHWDPKVKVLHVQNRGNQIARLKLELGEDNFETKLRNFKELGSSPFSIVAHHNVLFHQARYAFIHGFYYPALTASSALGERILNHLFLDLRENFPRSVHDRKSHKRSSIDDWPKAIAVLDEWGIFRPSEVKGVFEELKELRNRSVHFNASTTISLREDALKALGCLATIIEKQFGFQFTRAIPGSKGAFFLRKDAEADPFIRHYYLHQCPYVSPYYSMKFVNGAWLVFDRDVDSNSDASDEEFVATFMARTPEQLAPDDIPWRNGVSVVALTPAGVRPVEYRPDDATKTE
ncbi:hypothetical protein [Candidatus Methylomirabilis sp.]|uniref:hypothetical protein n=1 Tax=Candidatus Methylomirabilis sp. TaxID=2032687 RepID=UPI0030766B98